jgi:hypothetical protein
MAGAMEHAIRCLHPISVGAEWVAGVGVGVQMLVVGADEALASLGRRSSNIKS